MLTIFTTSKSFLGQSKIIQKNAIQSWTKLKPECEIILFDNEEGSSEVAREFGILHIPEIKKNEFGTPLLNDIFEKAQKIAKNNILAYVNADILLMNDFLKAVQQINLSKFLIVGRRWDLDVKESINFDNLNWEQELREKVKKEGVLHGPAGSDYFIFPKNFCGKIPSFAIGRTIWDNWLLYNAWILNIPLIDATQMIMAVHQNHGYPNKRWKSGVWKGPESKENQRLAGGLSHALTLRDVDLVLTSSGLEKPKRTFYRIFSFPFRYFEKLPALKILFFPGWIAIILWRKLQRLIP